VWVYTHSCFVWERKGEETFVCVCVYVEGGY